MPLLDHLIELRTRLIYCLGGFLVAFFVCFYVAEEIFSFLVGPLADALNDREGGRMIFTALQEAFFTYVKVAFFAAAFFAFPLISIQLWMFVAPGLYKTEKRAFMPFLIATPILFCVGPRRQIPEKDLVDPLLTSRFNPLRAGTTPLSPV